MYLHKDKEIFRDIVEQMLQEQNRQNFGIS